MTFEGGHCPEKIRGTFLRKMQEPHRSVLILTSGLIFGFGEQGIRGKRGGKFPRNKTVRQEAVLKVCS